MPDLTSRLDEPQRYYRRRAGDFHDWVTDYMAPVRPQMLHLLRAAPQWEPTEQWDAIFFANWLAHVPPPKLEGFWVALGSALKSDGHVVFVDVTSEERAIERRFWSEAAVEFVERETLDGEQFAVVKHYWNPVELLAQLRAWGWHGTATRVGEEDGRGFVFYSVGRGSERS